MSAYVQTSLIGRRVHYRNLSGTPSPWWPFDDDATDQAECVGVYIDDHGRPVLLVRADDGRVGPVSVANVVVP